MSQAKVDRYKEQKKNREKLMKKEKRERAIAQGVAALIGVCVIGWCGYSVYQTMNPSNKTEEVVKTEYTVNTSALDDFVGEMNVY